jgi:hypothetical protein
MEMPFNIVVALIAMMIFLLIVIAFAYYTKEEGQSVLDKIWNLGDWLRRIVEGNE